MTILEHPSLASLFARHDVPGYLVVPAPPYLDARLSLVAMTGHFFTPGVADAPPLLTEVVQRTTLLDATQYVRYQMWAAAGDVMAMAPIMAREKYSPDDILLILRLGEEVAGYALVKPGRVMQADAPNHSHLVHYLNLEHILTSVTTALQQVDLAALPVETQVDRLFGLHRSTARDQIIAAIMATESSRRRYQDLFDLMLKGEVTTLPDPISGAELPVRYLPLAEALADDAALLHAFYMDGTRYRVGSDHRRYVLNSAVMQTHAMLIYQAAPYFYQLQREAYRQIGFPEFIAGYSNAAAHPYFAPTALNALEGGLEMITLPVADQSTGDIQVHKLHPQDRYHEGKVIFLCLARPWMTS